MVSIFRCSYEKLYKIKIQEKKLISIFVPCITSINKTLLRNNTFWLIIKTTKIWMKFTAYLKFTIKQLYLYSTWLYAINNIISRVYSNMTYFSEQLPFCRQIWDNFEPYLQCNEFFFCIVWIKRNVFEFPSDYFYMWTVFFYCMGLALENI